jgi:DNA-binding GntR family transcriptional regulator
MGAPMKADLTAVAMDPNFAGRRITADWVADSLRHAIQTGALPDGAVLSQAAIAEHFDVSRVPVREAMRQLLAEGLIDSRAHHVSVVRGLSIERLAEVYENRAVLEGNLIVRATPRIPQDVIAELRREELAMRDERVHADWLRRNALFHQTMNEYAQDQTAMELVALLRSRAERYVHMWTGGEGVHNPETAGTEHALILDRVGAGDIEGARQAVEEHIRATGRRLVAHGERLAAESSV